MKHLHLLTLSLLALSCAAVSPAAAEELDLVVPGTVNFQGRLATADSKGALKPLTGVQRVDFRLCDAAVGGTTVWERQFPVTCTEDGSFNVTLDDGGTKLYPDQAVPRLADAFQGNERHFELSVEGYGTLAPRLLVTSSPYAFQAQYAAKAPGGFTVNGILTVGGTATFKGDFSAGSGTVASNLAVAAGGGKVKDVEITGTLIVPPGAINEMKGLIPVGGIMLWTQESVPNGWAVCDGKNGTPDLRARFVMGADDDHPSGTKGGEERVALSLGQMPEHQHGYPRPENDAGMESDISRQYALGMGDSQGDDSFMEVAGGGEPHENRPPYHAAYYIMRIQ